MSVVGRVGSATVGVQARQAGPDTLKLLLVVGVIVGHATMAWTGVGTWVLTEPPVREPLLTLLSGIEVIAALFALALFFLIAGAFTPRSLARKGLRRFLIDRTVRLGVPVVFFVLFLSPVVEYVDPDNAGWDRGFLAFAPHIWWPPAPGPTWFLEVLLLFSVAYAVVRTRFSSRPRTPEPMPGWVLVVTGLVIGVTSYALRFVVPIGEEHWHIAIAQAPAWIASFVLGAIAAERGWLDGIQPSMSRRLCLVAWSAVLAGFVLVGTASVVGMDLVKFAGGGTWQSLGTALIEGALVVAMSLWLFDLVRRRVDSQSHLTRTLSRAAFGAFVVHQIVLVGVVLATRVVVLPAEVEYVAAATLGVAGSFAIALLLLQIPGARRLL
jgi:Acyltransferase family